MPVVVVVVMPLFALCVLLRWKRMERFPFFLKVPLREEKKDVRVEIVCKYDRFA